jgi:hypothetical protein
LVAVDGLPVAETEADDAEDMAEAAGEEMGFDEAIRSGMME